MSISNHMREGAKLRPQAFGEYFIECNGNYCSCAMGAAYESVTNRVEFDLDYTDIIDLFDINIKSDPIFDCPEADNCDHELYLRHNDIVDIITHLNDHHLWSREAIADWLEERGY